MTCITACRNRKGKIMMAGDRRLTMDWSMAMEMPGPKIKKDDSGILIGAAGTGNLCTVLINIMAIPFPETNDTDIYMFFHFKKALEKALFISGYKDEHKLLKLPVDSNCSALVVVMGRIYMLDIRHPDDNVDHGNILSGIIEIEEAPLPYGVGCGASSSIPILLAERKRTGYNTKDGLKLAMEIASEISPGCSNQIDIIQED